MADEYGAATDQPEQTSQIPTEDPAKLANYWLNQLSFVERKYKKFWKRGDEIIKRYKNKRSYYSPTIPLTQKRMNIFWANVQTQMPVLFANLPTANVQRRNKDGNPVGRVAAMVLERCLENSIDMQPFDATIKQNVQDLLLVGQSIAITEYVPQVAENVIGWQEARTRYIHWKDWVTNIARTWEEVWFFAYKSYLTRKEVGQLLVNTGMKPEEAQKVQTGIILDHREDKEKDDTNAKATVWCIWDKSTQRVIHVSTGWEAGPLAVMPPPVNFDGFFPIARPLQATVASDSTIPVPDFEQYQDQCDEIDLLTQRINALVKSLRMRGAYAADLDSLKQMMENSSDQDMVPIDNWQLLMDKGGLEKALAWFPLEAIAKTLVQCYEARDKTIEAMYQITGIADIVRGVTEASETATAQQLKSQYAGIRVRDRQRDVQRYIRDNLRLQSEIIAEHFEQPVLQAMSGVRILTQAQKQQVQMYQQYVMQLQGQYQQDVMAAQQMQMPPPPQPAIPQGPPPEVMEAMSEPTWEEVIGLLRNEKLRGFVIDVETDSTVEPDQSLEQEKAEKFITAVTMFMQASLPIVQAAPFTGKLIGEMLKYGARQFKAGQQMETTIEQTVAEIEQVAQQPKQPDPKLQAEMAKADAQVKTAEIGVQKAQVQAQGDQQKHQMEGAKLVMEHQMDQAQAVRDDQAAARDDAYAERDAQRKDRLAETQARAKAAQARNGGSK